MQHRCDYYVGYTRKLMAFLLVLGSLSRCNEKHDLRILLYEYLIKHTILIILFCIISLRIEKLIENPFSVISPRDQELTIFLVFSSCRRKADPLSHTEILVTVT